MNLERDAVFAVMRNAPMPITLELLAYQPTYSKELLFARWVVQIFPPPYRENLLEGRLQKTVEDMYACCQELLKNCTTGPATKTILARFPDALPKLAVIDDLRMCARGLIPLSGHDLNDQVTGLDELCSALSGHPVPQTWTLAKLIYNTAPWDGPLFIDLIVTYNGALAVALERDLLQDRWATYHGRAVDGLQQRVHETFRAFLIRTTIERLFPCLPCAYDLLTAAFEDEALRASFTYYHARPDEIPDPSPWPLNVLRTYFQFLSICPDDYRPPFATMLCFATQHPKPCSPLTFEDAWRCLDAIRKKLSLEWSDSQLSELFHHLIQREATSTLVRASTLFDNVERPLSLPLVLRFFQANPELDEIACAQCNQLIDDLKPTEAEFEQILTRPLFPYRPNWKAQATHLSQKLPCPESQRYALFLQLLATGGQHVPRVNRFLHEMRSFIPVSSRMAAELFIHNPSPPIAALRQLKEQRDAILRDHGADLYLNADKVTSWLAQIESILIALNLSAEATAQFRSAMRQALLCRYQILTDMLKLRFHPTEHLLTHIGQLKSLSDLSPLHIHCYWEGATLHLLSYNAETRSARTQSVEITIADISTEAQTALFHDEPEEPRITHNKPSELLHCLTLLKLSYRALLFPEHFPLDIDCDDPKEVAAMGHLFQGALLPPHILEIQMHPEWYTIDEDMTLRTAHGDFPIVETRDAAGCIFRQAASARIPLRSDNTFLHTALLKSAVYRHLKPPRLHSIPRPQAGVRNGRRGNRDTSPTYTLLQEYFREEKTNA